MTPNHAYMGSKKIDLAKDTIYTHPSTQQCSSVNVSNATGVLPVNRGGTGTTSLDGFKTNLSIIPNKPTVTTVGSTFTLSSIEWIVVHNTGSIVYACSRYLIGASTFGYHKEYEISQLILFCKIFEYALGLVEASWVSNATINNSVSKLFIPTYEQFNGGFSYFSSDSRRICTTASGSAYSYWTSSPSNVSGSEPCAYYVIDDDRLSAAGGVSNVYGLRPCLSWKI